MSGINVSKAATTEADFVAGTTQNFVNLCAATPQDSHYREAIHFCQGYLVGVYHLYLIDAINPQNKLFCPPDAMPSRNEFAANFVTWAQKHPEFMSEAPIDTLFRFLTEKWPCKS
jgi:hypothetical protein